MNSFTDKWKIAVVVLAAVSLGGFALEHFMGYNPVVVAVNTVAAPAKSGGAYIVHSLEKACDFILDMRAYKEDNERLETEILELKRTMRDAGTYKEENDRLKELLSLKENMTDYTTVAANVISHSQNEWNSVVEINRGTLNGVGDGDVVITPDGLVGKVTETGPNYAMVSTVLNDSSVIGIKVARTDGTGLVEGDKELSENMQCKLSFVDKNTPVIVGDVIETSGSGGLYPSDLVIGTVIGVSSERTETLNYALIETSVDFGLLKEVLVITDTK